MKKYRNISRVLSVLLILAMLLPSISMIALSADTPCAADGCYGKYRSGICSADDTHFEAAPIENGIYQISNAGQLGWFAALVNAGSNEYNGDNGEVYDAVLVADIIIPEGMAWTPIGLYTDARTYVRYSGTFDGAGHTVYDLTYENTDYTGRNAGFFGTVDTNGIVKDLFLGDYTISGSTEIGGIASYNYGEISGCYLSGTVTGTGATGGIVCRNMEGAVIENCINQAVVNGATSGGIAAENIGSILNCNNLAAVSGTNSVGGVAGMNSGIISGARNRASVTGENTHVGGIVGNHEGGEIIDCGNLASVTGASDYIGGVAGACIGAKITKSFNAGAVTGDSGKSEAVGGVVGAIDGTNTAKSVIMSCYNTGAVVGRGWVGGIAGISGYQKTPMTVEITNSYNTGSVSGTNHTGAVVGKLSKGTVSGTYFLVGCAQNSVNGAISATGEQFASGEIAAKLNETSNVWYQTLDLVGMVPDASPVLDPEHGTIYYGYCDCSDFGYTNRENYNEPGDHVDEDGNMICDKCGTILGEAHDHEFGEWVRTKDPTCAEFGQETRICSICNYPEKRSIDKLPHTEELIPGTPATFDEPGMTDGKKCSVCGEIIQQQEVAPIRDYNEGIIPLNTLNISCGDWERNGGATEGPAELAVDDNMNTMWHTDWYGTSNENHWFQFELTESYLVDGLRYKPRQTGNSNGTITGYEIQVSNDGVNFETIASGAWANDRTWKVVEFDAQDVKYVRLASTASYCDNASVVCASAAEIRITGYKAGEQPHEHTPAEAVRENEKAATCTEAGSYDLVVYCSECNEELSRETVSVDALGHTEEIIPGKAATCTETGLTEGKKCAVCDEILVAQEVIPALGHDWDGTSCKRCDEKRENPFVDVDEVVHKSFLNAILWASEEGITTGTDASHFNPSGTCMRGHVVTFLWRAMGEPEPTITENPFVDVDAKAYYYKAVLWAYEKGITTGIDATHFNPTGKCNRAQVVTFLWRAVGKPGSTATESGFTDVTNTQEFYYDAVLWAVENGITNGMGDGTFGVLKTCNRAQVVTFLYRTFA